MKPAAFAPRLSLSPFWGLALVGCTQSQINRSATDVLGSVILAGGPIPSRPSPLPSPAPAPAARKVLETADQYLGVPYKWGGSTPAEGFDCSGYVRYVYGKQGVRLPRTSREQVKAGAKVTARISSLRAGDLMMFAEPKQAISHVAIYAGNGRIIHSSSSGGGVRYDVLDSRRGQWYRQRMVAARRLAVDGRSLVQALELISRPGLPFDPPDGAPPPER
jgi:cell wall-associated NlpC family hydrolase